MSKNVLKFWTVCGTRGFKLETPNLLWLHIELFCSCMQKIYNFHMYGSMGCHIRNGRRIKKTTENNNIKGIVHRKM